MTGAADPPLEGEVAARGADGGVSRSVGRGHPSTTRFASGPPPLAGEEFRGAALRLAGFCCLRLGWSPDAFWRATPAEVEAVAAVLTPAGDAPVGRVALAELERELGDG